MRILRLTTTESSSIFDSYLDGEVLVEPNSQIALASVSCELDSESIRIDSSNSKVLFNVSDTAPHIARLPVGTFSGENFRVFFSNFETTLNQTIGDLDANQEIKTASEIGKQFQILLVGERIQISCNKAQASPRGADLLANAALKTLNGVANTKCVAVTNLNANTAALSSASKTTLGADSYKATTFQTHPIAKGCGIHRARCRALRDVGGSADGFSIGLHETSPTFYTENRDMAIDDVAYGIKAVTSYGAAGEQTGSYRYVIDGISFPTSVPISEAKLSASSTKKDVVSLEISNGKIRGVIYQAQDGQNPPLVNVLFTDDYDNNTDLFASYTLHGAGNTAAAGATSAYSCLIDQMRFTPDPYQQPPDSLVATDTELLGGSGTTNQYNQPTNHRITFPPAVGKWLGFDSPELFSKGSFQVGFSATSAFRPSILNNAILLEMLSFSVDSFDLTPNKRKRANLLAVIPFNGASYALKYEPNELAFLSMNNAKKLNLREIQCRLVREDYSPLKMLGMASLILCVRDPPELQKRPDKSVVII